MARGNWNPNVIKPKTRCKLCGFIKASPAEKWVYINGCNPAHKSCAERKNIKYTLEMVKKETVQS
jgi:hypothetical protein